MKERVLPWWFPKRDERAGAVRIPAKPDYTIVSSVNTKLLTLLRKHMVPQIVAGREEIGLCNPSEPGDLSFGVFLYDIQENDYMRINGMTSIDPGHVQMPPLYLDLYYMLTAYSNVDVRYREEDNHRMLVRAMQILHDYAGIDGELPMHIEMVNLTLDQKTNIWSRYNQGYRLSVFYKVSPVMLESAIKREVTRVREIQVDTVQGGKDGKNG